MFRCLQWSHRRKGIGLATYRLSGYHVASPNFGWRSSYMKAERIRNDVFRKNKFPCFWWFVWIWVVVFKVSRDSNMVQKYHDLTLFFLFCKRIVYWNKLALYRMPPPRNVSNGFKLVKVVSTQRLNWISQLSAYVVEQVIDIDSVIDTLLHLYLCLERQPMRGFHPRLSHCLLQECCSWTNVGGDGLIPIL